MKDVRYQGTRQQCCYRCFSRESVTLSERIKNQRGNLCKSACSWGISTNRMKNGFTGMWDVLLAVLMPWDCIKCYCNTIVHGRTPLTCRFHTPISELWASTFSVVIRTIFEGTPSITMTLYEFRLSPNHLISYRNDIVNLPHSEIHRKWKKMYNWLVIVWDGN